MSACLPSPASPFILLFFALVGITSTFPWMLHDSLCRAQSLQRDSHGSPTSWLLLQARTASRRPQPRDLIAVRKGFVYGTFFRAFSFLPFSTEAIRSPFQVLPHPPTRCRAHRNNLLALVSPFPLLVHSILVYNPLARPRQRLSIEPVNQESSPLFLPSPERVSVTSSHYLRSLRKPQPCHWSHECPLRSASHSIAMVNLMRLNPNPVEVP